VHRTFKLYKSRGSFLGPSAPQVLQWYTCLPYNALLISTTFNRLAVVLPIFSCLTSMFSLLTFASSIEFTVLQARTTYVDVLIRCRCLYRSGTRCSWLDRAQPSSWLAMDSVDTLHVCILPRMISSLPLTLFPRTFQCHSGLCRLIAISHERNALGSRPYTYCQEIA
jgi:hypothetical protein